MSSEQIRFRVDSSSIERLFPSTGDAILASLTRRITAINAALQRKIAGGKLQGNPIKSHTDKLAGSVRVIPTRNDGEKITGGVQAGGGPAPYAKFLEDGSAPHVIRPRDVKGVLAFEVGGKHIFARSVNHPGTKAYLFMKGTLAEEQANIVEQLRDAVREAAR